MLARVDRAYGTAAVGAFRKGYHRVCLVDPLFR